MSDLETAHAFCVKVCGFVVDSMTTRRMTPAQANAEALRLIEADRRAVALNAKRALLAEIRARAAELDAPKAAIARCVFDAFGEAERKYAIMLEDAEEVKRG